MKLLDDAYRLSKKNPAAKRAFKKFEKLGNKAANWTENQIRSLEKYVRNQIKSNLNAADKAKVAARSKPFVQSKTGAARKVPQSKLQRKINKAKTGNDLVTQGSRTVAKPPGSAVATQGSRAVTKRPGSAVATQGSRAVTKRPGSASSNGKIVGLSNKANSTLTLTAAAAALAAANSGDKNKKTKAEKPLSKLPSKTVPTRKTPVPVDDTPRPKRKPVTPKERPVQGPKNKPLKPYEQGVRYIDNPFGKGKIKVDSTDEGMAFEEFDQKYGGKVMTRKKGGKAKPRRRAALRGHRAEQRGG